MKRVCLVILTLVSAFPILAQNQKLDSLYRLLEIHPAKDSNRVKLLYNISYYENMNDPEKLRQLAFEALDISEEIGFQRGIGISHKYIGLYYRSKGDYAEASEHAFQMLKTFEGTKDANGWGQAYQFLSLINQETGNLEKSKEYSLKAMEVFEKGGRKLDLAFAYNNFGALSMEMKDYDEALKTYFKAIEMFKAIHYENYPFIYANIGIIYKRKKDYENALQYFEKVFTTDGTGYKETDAEVWIEFGDLCALTGDYSKADEALNKGLALAKDVDSKKLQKDAYEKLTFLEKERRNYKMALEYQTLSHQYKDSIFTEENGKKLSELEVRYQTEQKDRTIQQLEHQDEIRRLQNYFVYAGLLFIVVCFVVWILLQRAHNKKVRSLLTIQKSLNIQLKESDELKSKFFANISHELRTPLTLILAPIEDKLQSSKLKSEDRNTFQLIRRNAKRLLALINEILDLSKLEAGKMELHIQAGDLKETIAVIAASFDSLAEHRGIKFYKNIDFSFDETWFDADKIEKIVNNLLANAIKFTPKKGTVTFSVHKHSDSGITIIVTDTGKGIHPEEQEHVFQPFYQSRYNDDSQPGTGLGLPLVKELVKLYGGVIDLESEVGKGTAISVVLPVQRGSFDAATTEPLQQGIVEESTDVGNEYEQPEDEVVLGQKDGDSVLIIEDNQELRSYMASLLTDRYTVFTASDGEEGFAQATEHIPSLILSDVMMPKVNGIELAEKIKADERTSHIPIIMLTAKADEDSKLRGLQTGADDYLAKPFSVVELKVRIENLVEQRKRLAAKFRQNLSMEVTSANAPREASTDEKFLAKVRQVVEDNLGNNQFGVEQLASEVNLSRAQLFRKLKALSSFSPNEFINEIRLQKAAEMIRNRVDGLTQISYRVGYNEQSYFAKRFRKKFGATPSEYQATHSAK